MTTFPDEKERHAFYDANLELATLLQYLAVTRSTKNILSEIREKLDAVNAAFKAVEEAYAREVAAR